jgi:hypothetical protein
MKKVTMTISVDWENNGEKFWESFNKKADSIKELDDMSELDEWRFKTTPERAQEIVTFLEGLDGWNDGPSHAPHPLIISID